MRRVSLLLVMMVVALVLGSGVALATVKYGTGGSDYLEGTSEDDVLYGRGGNDGLAGKGEDDVLYGGAESDFVGTYCLDFVMDTGNDVMYAGSGNDFIMAVEAPFRYPNLQERDVVFCGPGTDEVYYQEGVDRLFDCERKNPR